jgi:RNA polymerase sigma-70 factor (ECF subfamily)
MDDHASLRAAVESIEAPEEFDLVKSYGRDEATRLVRVVLDRLPANYGDALEWKYLEGDSVESIGKRLGIGTVAAQSLLARARIAFREGLEAVFGSEAADIASSLGA